MGVKHKGSITNNQHIIALSILLLVLVLVNILMHVAMININTVGDIHPVALSPAPSAESSQKPTSTLAVIAARVTPIPSHTPHITPVETQKTLSYYKDNMDYEESIKILSSMESVESFYINSAFFNDFLSLPVMKGLKRLTIINDNSWEPTSDISALATLKADKLEELEIEDTNISDISPISGLTGIKTLYLRRNYISDLSPIASLVNLEDLCLSYESVEDFSAITMLPNLKILSIYSVGDSIDTLAGATSLEEITFNMYDVQSIKALKSMKNLKKLKIYPSMIKDISPLASLKNLEYIDMYTASTDITPLAGLINLKYLDVYCAGVKDITALVNLKNAEYIGIHCRDEYIDDADIEVLREALPHCTIDITGSEKGVSR